MNNEATDYQHPLQKGMVRAPSVDGVSRDSSQTNQVIDESENEAPSLDKIKNLMENGYWRNTIKFCDRYASKSLYRHEVVQLGLAKVVSYIKLRMYKAASDELLAIGEVDDKLNQYESYPQHYPANMKGSIIPFSLRVIKAEMPFLLKTSNSLDGLYTLLSVCRKEVEALQNQQQSLQEKVSIVPQLANSFLPLTFASRSVSFTAATDIEPIFGSFEENLDLWVSREVNLSLLIVTHLCQEKEFQLAVTLITTLTQKYPKFPELFSFMGRMQLQMGNTKAATNSFKKYEQLLSEPDKSPDVLINRGYLALAVDQFSTAMDHFQAVLDLQPSNVVAANNRAICMLYTCNLTLAVATLEEFIAKDPKLHLNETLIFNLCTLYDLKSDNSNEKKKAILSLVGKYAPDSFDFSVIKLGV